MDRQTKAREIDVLRDRFGRMASAVFSDFRGLTVADAGALRNFCREADVELRVVKNTFLREVTKGEPYREALAPHIRGMTIVAWSYEDPLAPVRALTDYARKNDKLKVKCALLEGKVLGAADVQAVARLPGKDQMRAQLLATFQAPAAQFVRTLAAAAQNLTWLLDARKRALG